VTEREKLLRYMELKRKEALNAQYGTLSWGPLSLAIKDLRAGCIARGEIAIITASQGTGISLYKETK
jgi:hypothetical protein